MSKVHWTTDIPGSPPFKRLVVAVLLGAVVLAVFTKLGATTLVAIAAWSFTFSVALIALTRFARSRGSAEATTGS